MFRRLRFVLGGVSALLLGIAQAGAQPTTTEKVLIRTPKPYTNAVAAISSRGGKVTQKFKYTDAIAAEIPASAIADLRAVLGSASFARDVLIAAPRDMSLPQGKPTAKGGPAEVPFGSAKTLAAADIKSIAQSNPAAYLINNAISGVDSLHATGKFGQGMVVAVIDSGIRPGFPHIELDGSVIGGEDFVGDGFGYSNSFNNGHGTFVAGMISANVAFVFPSGDPLPLAVKAYAPGSVIANGPMTIVPMIGSAPLSSIYALRVFGPSGGAPASVIIAAAERVIELRKLYDAGQPGGINISVCNMSLGGATIAPGLDVFDQTIDAMLKADIVPVIAVGNAGPATLTTGSPGSSFSAVTVGAANLAHNERILREVQYGPGFGLLFRPSGAAQIAYFSSRGPNADGRPDPDIVASGFASFGQGFGVTGSIGFGSGASFSAPTVAGIAAVLRQAYPSATARQIRNALLTSANPAMIPGATNVDQGAGYVNAAAASSLLAGGSVPDTVALSFPSSKNVKVNIEQNTSLRVQDGIGRGAFQNLKPGERRDLLYRINPNTSQVVISFSGFTSLPAAQQNQIFGDDLLVAVHSAKTSAVGEGDYKHFTFMRNGTLVVDAPEEGILRVSVSGDWTNAGAVSTSVTVFSTKDPLPKFTTQNKISEAQGILQSFTVPAGVQQMDARLEWREDWSTFPTADLDLILLSPSGPIFLEGATLSNPEMVRIANPPAGQWLALVLGSSIPAGTDKFELRIALDGHVIKP